MSLFSVVVRVVRSAHPTACCPDWLSEGEEEQQVAARRSCLMGVPARRLSTGTSERELHASAQAARAPVQSNASGRRELRWRLTRRRFFTAPLTC